MITQDFVHGADYAALAEAANTFRGLLSEGAGGRRAECGCARSADGRTGGVAPDFLCGRGVPAVLGIADRPSVAVGILIAARLLTGIGESFIITAVLSWGIAHVGPAHAGKMIGWVGMALFAAYAAGAPQAWRCMRTSASAGSRLR